MLQNTQQNASQISTNGLIRCYNLFPSYFKNIDEMTSYLPNVKALGMNVVWINPLQLAGKTKMTKSDPITGQDQEVFASLYAMADHTIIDPRFSVVQRDKDGDMVLTKEQIRQVTSINVKDTIKKIKTLKHKISALDEKILKRNSTIAKNKRTLQSSKRGSSGLHQQISDQEKYLVEETAELASNKRKLTQLLLIQEECVRQFDVAAIKKFTQTAKALGITPIFDLVLNHVARDSLLVTKSPELFNMKDTLYHDTTAFTYSNLQLNEHIKKLSEIDIQEINKKIDIIMKTFWGPYIDRYVQEFGFCGARMDCIKKVPQQLRQAVYKRIHQGVATLKDAVPVVILEETLFSDLSPKDFVEQVKGAGATHNTGSVYYKPRLWHGGLEYDYSKEDYYKKSTVQSGVINFTGNHDHYSCAMTVCRELAYERLQSNSKLYQNYLSSIQASETECASNGKIISEAKRERIKSIYIHYYVNEIIKELNNPDDFNDTVNRFGIAYRDKLLTMMFVGSGGYYMLSGDEFASLHQPSVFLRANGKPIYSQTQLAIFNPEHKYYHLGQQVLKEMATKSITAKKYKDQFAELDSENQDRMLSAFAEQIKNEINSDVQPTRNNFENNIYDMCDDISLEEEPLPKNVQNAWGRPKSLEKYTQSTFFQEMNNIITQLPSSKEGYWSELFKAVDSNILIAVKSNGKGFDSKMDVVIVNLNPNKTLQIAKQDIEKIAGWLQARTFPRSTQAVNPDADNPDFHKSYGCIMGSSDYKLAPANLYFGGLLTLDEDVLTHRVEIEGRQQSFNIVVNPQPIPVDPLMTEAPKEMHQESYTTEQLMQMFEVPEAVISRPASGIDSGTQSDTEEDDIFNPEAFAKTLAFKSKAQTRKQPDFADLNLHFDDFQLNSPKKATGTRKTSSSFK